MVYIGYLLPNAYLVKYNEIAFWKKCVVDAYSGEITCMTIWMSSFTLRVYEIKIMLWILISYIFMQSKNFHCIM